MSLVVLVGVIDPGGDAGRLPTVLAAFTSVEQCEEARPGILDEYHEQWPRAWMECYSMEGCAMTVLQDLLAKVSTTNDVLYTNFELGAGGKILDPNGRLICTMNLKDLTLSEAFAYAAHFMVSIDLADQLRALIAQEGEAWRAGK